MGPMRGDAADRSADWLDAIPDEVRRLHALGDRWLGEALLRLVRTVRSAAPSLGREPPDVRGADADLTWDVVPELCRRLGCALRPGESVDPALRRAEGAALRILVSDALRSMSHPGLRAADAVDAPLDPVALLTRAVVNGSPVAIALDRVAPPTALDQDRCALKVRHASRRRNHPVTSAWHPSLQSWRPVRIPPTEEPGEDAPALR